MVQIGIVICHTAELQYGDVLTLTWDICFMVVNRESLVSNGGCEAVLAGGAELGASLLWLDLLVFEFPGCNKMSVLLHCCSTSFCREIGN